MRRRLVHIGLLGIALGVAVYVVLAMRTRAPGGPASGPTLFATPAPPLSAAYEPQPPAMPREFALKQIYTLNQSAFIPPQCYTKTVDSAGKAHNPCYTCHVASRAPNYINDPDIQLEYAFVPRARKNHWKNLFIDWTSKIGSISDEEILAYVRKSNYFDERQNIILAKQLSPPRREWDHGSDGKWSGFIPDARFHFDEQGFDRSAAGDYTGWRALAYYPVPGTFWPTNGSMGDVLIRLPAAFRERVPGKFDLDVYKLNLAIVETLILRRALEIEPVDEATLGGVDLDRDGKIGLATKVAFVPTPEEAPDMSFVGRARDEQRAGRVHLAVGLYPEGTEFLHTVRYLDPTPDGIQMAARLKELRYAKKIEWWTYKRLDKRARVEAISKVDSPSELRNFGGDIERGVNNTQGWTLQGFIEDESGALRPQSFEETVYCIGCHGGVGAVDDGIFSFSRRLGTDAHQRGWYHWTQRGLKGVRDRAVHAGGTEYVSYLEQNGAGDEFRQNTEIIERFFDPSGKLKPHMKARLQRDVSLVLLPSPERALALNKAYRLLVKEQSFRLGRELVLDGARNVHRGVEESQKTGIEAAVEPAWSGSPTTIARKE